MKKRKFLLFVSSTHKKLHNEAGLDENVYSRQGQAALSAVTGIIRVRLVHNLLQWFPNWEKIIPQG